jgi:hypothetical protein
MMNQQLMVYFCTDYDNVILKTPLPLLLQNKKELVGRTTAKPHVQLAGESYSQPRLQWYELFNGDEVTGSILAAFQLFEVCELKIFPLFFACFSVLLHSLSVCV